MSKRIYVLIPAFNEAEAIAQVIRAIPHLVDRVVVVDNHSTDRTAEIARGAGAEVVFEPKKGYGHACLRGMQHIKSLDDDPQVLVFMDGDFSDDASLLPALVAPILADQADLVIGSRVARLRAPGSMTLPQRFGNALATTLMRLFFGSRFTDLGPFRAMHWEQLLALEMEDKTYGWTVEMQLKALRKGLRYTEIPVPYKERIGVSKVSGTLKGAIFAGVKILGWIFKYSVK